MNIFKYHFSVINEVRTNKKQSLASRKLTMYCCFTE